MDFSKINWKQPKYMLPAIVFFPVLFVGYQICEIFSGTQTDEGKIVQTDDFNTDLPETKKTEIKNKYQSMLEDFGKTTDYTGVETVEKELNDHTPQPEKLYTDKEIERIDSLKEARLIEQAEQQRKHLEQLQQENRTRRKEYTFEDNYPDGRPSERDREHEENFEKMARQMKALREAVSGEPPKSKQQLMQEEMARIEAEARKKIEDSIRIANAPIKVTKAVADGSEFFNTVSEEQSPHLIKGRVDEMVKAVDGSRLRIRLSEDVRINEDVLTKGSYLYATVTGFSAQRVKATVTSVMIGGKIRRIQLKVYDLDCMEGFYVPASKFREFTKDIGAGTMSNMNVNMNSSGQQSLESVAMQSLQQALSTTTNAIGKAIKQNKAKIKFGTEIYLVDDSNNQ